jgi:hypothetical protein
VFAKSVPRPHRQDRAAGSPFAKLLPPTSHNTHNHLSTFFTSSKLTMAFEGGLASDPVSASVLRPAPVGQPTSQGGPQAEFHVTERIGLLKTLKNALDVDIPPTVWACLWLSDIDRLKVLVNTAKEVPSTLEGHFMSIEHETRIVQKCEVYRLPCVLVDLLMLILSREPTRPQALCPLEFSASIHSTDAIFLLSNFPNSTTFPNSTAFLNATTISYTATLHFAD